MLLAAFTLVVGLTAFRGTASVAPCKVNNALGSVSSGVNIQQAGEYKIWVRIRPESKTANTVYLEIDGNACLVAGNSDGLPARTWSWVDYGGQGAGRNLTHDFESTGRHTIKIIGNETGVGVDRLLLLAATDTCTPSNTVTKTTQPGDNCKKSDAVVDSAEDEPLADEQATSTSAPMSLGKKIALILGGILTVGILGFLALLLFRRLRRRRFGRMNKGLEILPK